MLVHGIFIFHVLVKGESMDALLANKLFDSISGLTKFNLSIIDEYGKILASKSEELIGIFHETAFRLIKSQNEIIVIDRDDPESGIRESVYMVLFVNRHRAGVIGVYGNAQEVLPVIRVMKHSLEVMLEFELYKKNVSRKYTAKERVLKILFSDDYEYSDLERVIRDTSLDIRAPRIPVLIEIEDSFRHASQLCHQIDQGTDASKQDLTGITNEGNIFLLKSVYGENNIIMEDYKYILGDSLCCALHYIRSNNLKHSIYVGPIENDIAYYRQAFLYCRWMQNHIKQPGSYYFYNYVVKYLETMASQNEFHAVFSYLKQELGEKFIESYVEVMDALVEKDYNLTKASSALHVHKNTLVYRLDKIRSILSMNPLSSSSEREFMECFYIYLTQGGHTT